VALFGAKGPSVPCHARAMVRELLILDRRGSEADDTSTSLAADCRELRLRRNSAETHTDPGSSLPRRGNVLAPFSRRTIGAFGLDGDSIAHLGNGPGPESASTVAARERTDAAATLMDARTIRARTENRIFGTPSRQGKGA
jgi:hypothetical protein